MGIVDNKEQESDMDKDQEKAKAQVEKCMETLGGCICPPMTTTEWHEWHDAQKAVEIHVEVEEPESLNMTAVAELLDSWGEPELAERARKEAVEEGLLRIEEKVNQMAEDLAEIKEYLCLS